jgi:hypothetical protein
MPCTVTVAGPGRQPAGDLVSAAGGLRPCMSSAMTPRHRNLDQLPPTPRRTQRGAGGGRCGHPGPLRHWAGTRPRLGHLDGRDHQPAARSTIPTASSPQPSRARHRTRRPSAPRRLPAASRIAHCRGHLRGHRADRAPRQRRLAGPGRAAVEAWVIEGRMLYGIHPFDKAGSREIAVQVRRASNFLSHRFNHPIAVDRIPSWRTGCRDPGTRLDHSRDRGRRLLPSSRGRPRR